MAEWSPPPVEDSIPPAVPIARPVALDASEPAPVVPDASAPAPGGPRRLTALRAVVELILLLIAVGVAAFALILLIQVFSSIVKGIDARWLGMIHTLMMGAVAVMLCLAIVMIDRHPVQSIGLTLRQFGVNVGIGVGTLVLMMAMLMAFGLMLMLLNPELITEQSAAQKGIEDTFPRMSLSAMMAITVGVVFWEEVLFRGFLLTRLQAVFRRWWLTIPIGAVIFGIPHGYQGPLAMGTITILGVVLGSLFAWRRSLVPTIVFHFLFNTSTFLLLEEFSTTWQ